MQRQGDRRLARSARRSTHGIAYVTEDRKTYGLILIDDIKHNITLANLPGVSPARRDRRRARDRRSPTTTATSCNIRSLRASTRRPVNLSGGNQQKVVLSKWLFANPEVLILDEPTRGIDVGAKYEIYTHHQRAGRARAKAIIVISSEMPELLGICDRIYVMNEGRFVGEMPAAEATPGKDHARHHAAVQGEQHEHRNRTRTAGSAAAEQPARAPLGAS